MQNEYASKGFSASASIDEVSVELKLGKVFI